MGPKGKILGFSFSSYISNFPPNFDQHIVRDVEAVDFYLLLLAALLISFENTISAPMELSSSAIDSIVF